MTKTLSSSRERFAARRAALMRRVRADHAVDCALITQASDIRYLCGATEGVPALIIGRGWAVALTAKMFENDVPRQAPGCEVVVTQAAWRDIGEHLRRKQHRRGLGIQGHGLSWVQHAALHKALGRRKLVDIGQAAGRLRAVKDATEIRLIRRCVRIAEQAYRDLLAQGPTYLLSRTERELAAELEYRMCLHGADRQAFIPGGTIVASGPNSASCHHFPTARRPRRGEPLLFDWGAEKDGYRSDITRTVFLGEPSATLRALFETVRQANAAGIAAVRPNTHCTTVAREGWSAVRAAGYGKLIRHGLGHGIGLEIHEGPGLGTGDPQPSGTRPARLKSNMVITIEPGIYLPGVGGVRIEDDVLVTPKGPRRLTRLPRDLASAILH